MQRMSADALAVPTGSHKTVCTVNAWLNGALMASDIPLVSGSLTVTAGQAVRSRLSLVVADASGRLTPKPGTALTPWGGELHVQAGVMVGPVAEMVSLGWFPIMTATTTEEWRPYLRTEEPERPYMVSRGLSVQVEAADRAQIVADARFENREQPVYIASAIAEIGRLLQGVVPWQVPAGITDRVVPADMTYDDDRMGAWQKLATAMNCEPVIDTNGVATLLPTDSPAASVWTIKGGVGGSQIGFSRALSRDQIYNAVIARSSDTQSGLNLQGRAVVVEGPLRYDGPLGRIPYFYASPVLTTQDAVDKAAQTTLARITTRRSQSITVSMIPNYALEVGDVVTLQCPYGYIDAEITTITYPLTPGLMALTLAVNPVQFAAVS